jgi:phosphopantothenoylcysteine decarboxylase/phosphopantothenate--cysteine ligase
MLQAVEAELPCDIAIFTAAVADWRIARAQRSKIKRQPGRPPHLTLEDNPDILKEVSSAGARRPRVVIGFAAETDDVIARGMEKLKTKGCDLIIANDVSPETGVLGGERNRVHVISAGGIESWPDMTKQEVAERLMNYLAGPLSAPAKAAE